MLLFIVSVERIKTNDVLVLRLIKHMNFDLQPISLPSLEYFDNTLLQKVSYSYTF